MSGARRELGRRKSVCGAVAATLAGSVLLGAAPARADEPGWAFETTTPPPPPAVRVAPPRPSELATATVTFEPATPELTLLYAIGGRVEVDAHTFRSVIYYEVDPRAPRYASVCDGACTKTIPAGQHAFAVGDGSGNRAAAGELFVLGPVTLRASYESRRGRRIAGGAIGLVGIAATAGLLVVAGHADGETGLAEDAGAVAVGIASIVVGTVLGFSGDRASLVLVPLPTSGPRATGGTPAPRSAQGAGIGVRF